MRLSIKQVRSLESLHPSVSLGGRENCRSLGCARDDKGKGGDFLWACCGNRGSLDPHPIRPESLFVHREEQRFPPSANVNDPIDEWSRVQDRADLGSVAKLKRVLAKVSDPEPDATDQLEWGFVARLQIATERGEAR